jgi:hypothetical protein
MLALDKTVNARPDLAALARSSAGFPLGGALGGGGGGGGGGGDTVYVIQLEML